MALGKNEQQATIEILAYWSHEPVL